MSQASCSHDLAQFLNNSPQALLLVDVQGRIVFLNPAFPQHTGYTHKDIQHLSDWFSLSSMDQEQAGDRLAQWGEWQRCRGPVSCSWGMRHRDGFLQHVTISATFLDDGRAVVELQDDTDRIRIEKELKDNQDKHAALARASFEAVLILDRGYILECNQSSMNMFGYSRDELIGMYCTDLVIPEYRGVTISQISDCRETPCEVVARRRDGSSFPAELQSRTFTYRKRSARATVIRDISERKAAERVPHTLHAISNAVSTIRDLDQLYTTVHSILDTAIGAPNFFIAIVDQEQNRLTFPYFVDEQDDDSHLLDIDNPETRSLSLHVIRSGKPLFITGETLQSPDLAREIRYLGPLPAVWIGVPLRPRGVITGIMALQHYHDPHFYTQADLDLFQTVSSQVALGIERLKAEEDLSRLNNELEALVSERTRELTRKASELEEANARLTELDAIKNGLLSSVSHEMRTPLTSIRGFAHMVDRDFARHFEPLGQTPRQIRTGARIRNNLYIMARESERLTRLINDFLDLSRIESGRMEWNDAPMDVAEVLHQAVEAVMGNRQEERDVELRLDIQPGLRPLLADRDRIQQLAINLLHNAVKFTPQGEVGIEARPLDNALMIKVWDTGIGIADNERERIFERFHQSAQHGKPRGTGLGLSICKQIVDRYQGNINVTSTPGKGSSFTVTLPYLPQTH